jgi:DNA-binding transcriptional regulator YiaG
MTESEQNICSRVKQFRELIRWSQPDFAKAIGITRDQLANIEYRRSPVRYPLGVTICQVFDISGQWLAIGEGNMHGGCPALWVVDFEPKDHKSELFSEVYSKNPAVFKDDDRKEIEPVSKPTPGFNPEAFLMRSVYDWYHENRFSSEQMAENFARVLAMFANDMLKQLRWKGRVTNPRWEPGTFPFIPKNPLDKIPDNVEQLHQQQIRRLTIDVNARTTGIVSPALPKLIERLKRATEARGRKTELAAWLKVPRQSVTDWLSNRQEPGGETTLQLLHWVEQQERKK